MAEKICHSLVILFMSLLFTCAAFADSGHSGKIALDQSQNIFFEQFSSNRFGLQLMQSKDKFDYETLVFGGMAEADLQHWQGDSILTAPLENYQTGNGLYLTAATIDMLVNIATWGAAYVSVAGGQIGQGGASGNYIYYSHAFITLGNLNRFPAYFIFGINNVPFAILTGSGVWDTPITSDYFNPQQVPQINLAFYKNNLNLNAFAFKDQVNYEYHYGASFNYQQVVGSFNYGVGAGSFTNLKTNAAGNIGTINVRKNIVPEVNLGTVWDANARIGYKLITLTGDFLRGSNNILTATSKPVAYSLTLSYAPTLFDKVTTFGINQSASFNFNNIPASLPGQDAVELAQSGLKRALAISVSRPVYKENITLGLDAVRALTYGNLHTFAYTLDLILYL